eukprot:m51a1_g2799 hypothetical protein (118) ;mRNA; f:76273-76870
MSCGCCCRAPRDVYSGTVVNNTGAPIHVSATYSTAAGYNQPAIPVTVDVPAGGSANLEQRLFDMGGCQYTYAITNVSVGGASLAAPFNEVTSPVKGYYWVVGGSAPSFTLSGSLKNH